MSVKNGVLGPEGVLETYYNNERFKYRAKYQCPCCDRVIGACGLLAHLRSHERKGELNPR